MMRYRRASLDEVMDAVKAQTNGNLPPLGSWHQQEKAFLQPYRDAVKGGKHALKFLIRRPDEDPLLFGMRVETFQNINVCEIVVDEQSHFAYGAAPERRVSVIGTTPEDPINETVSTEVRRIYEDNLDYVHYRQRLIPSAIGDRWAWQKIWWDAQGNIRFGRFKRENVYAVRDPMDPDGTLLGSVEVIDKGGGNYRCTLFTVDTVFDMTDGWQVTGQAPNPLAAWGVVPLIPYGDMDCDGRHSLADALLDQIVLINMRSWELSGWRAQAFAIFVAAGEMINEEEVSGVDGQKRTRAGMESFLQFEKDGKFYAVNPNFPIMQVREALSGMLKESLERAKVSSSAIDPSGVPEQPWTAIMRHLRPLQDRQLNIASFGASERESLRAVTAAARRLGKIPVDSRALDFDIQYPKHVLPLNEKEERTADLGDVDSNLRLAEDYVTRWVKAGASKEEVDAYMKMLEEQRRSRSQGVLDILGSPRGAVGGSLTQSIFGNEDEVEPETEPAEA